MSYPSPGPSRSPTPRHPGRRDTGLRSSAAATSPDSPDPSCYFVILARRAQVAGCLPLEWVIAALDADHAASIQLGIDTGGGALYTDAQPTDVYTPATTRHVAQEFRRGQADAGTRAEHRLHAALEEWEAAGATVLARPARDE